MSVTCRETLVDRDVRPDRCWRKRPSKGQTGVPHELRTRGRNLRIHRNHANPSRFERRRAAYKSIVGVLQYGGAAERPAQNWKYKNSSRCHMPNSEIAS